MTCARFFPWKTSDGKKAMDSCCIALINHKLHWVSGGNDAWNSVVALPSWVDHMGQLKDHPGCGALFTSYLPKPDARRERQR